MLTHECSKSLPNAIIERTIIWILAWKLYFSSAAAAAGDSSSRARLCALARASLSTSAVGGGVGACSASAPLLPDAAAASAGSAGEESRRRSLGELRSFAGASFSRQLGARELRQLTQWYDRKHTKEVQTRPAVYLAASTIASAVSGYSSARASYSGPRLLMLSLLTMAATIWRTRSAVVLLG